MLNSYFRNSRANLPWRFQTQVAVIKSSTANLNPPRSSLRKRCTTVPEWSIWPINLYIVRPLAKCCIIYIRMRSRGLAEPRDGRTDEWETRRKVCKYVEKKNDEEGGSEWLFYSDDYQTRDKNDSNLSRLRGKYEEEEIYHSFMILRERCAARYRTDRWSINVVHETTCCMDQKVGDISLWMPDYSIMWGPLIKDDKDDFNQTLIHLQSASILLCFIAMYRLPVHFHSLKWPV